MEFRNPESFKMVSGNSEVSPIWCGDSNSLLIKGVRVKDEKCVSEWVLNKMEEFGPFLGMSFDGLENETIELFKRIELRRSCGLLGVECWSLVSKRLKIELTKLENSVNYEKKVGWLSEGCLRRGKAISLV